VRRCRPTPSAHSDGFRVPGNRHWPGTGHDPRSRRRLRQPQSSILHDRRRTTSDHAHQKDSSHDPRAMKRAMKSALLTGQIVRPVHEHFVEFPEFLGAPGRIRTCAPASGGRSINPSGTAIDPCGYIQALRRPRILCDAQRFIARTIARAAVATGLFGARQSVGPRVGSGRGYGDGDDEFGTEGGGDALQHRDGRHGTAGLEPRQRGLGRVGTRVATSVWNRPSASRRSRTSWPIKNARRPCSYPSPSCALPHRRRAVCS
jgi:hypothetical protein